MKLFLNFVVIFLLLSCDNNQQEKVIPSLIDAAEQGDLRVMDDFLAGTQLVNMRDACRWTPLMKAALNGHLDAVEKLLDKGAGVDLVDKGGYSAMMLAASNNFSKVVDLLIRHGADVNRIENTNGWTALIWAAKRGHKETVRVLLKHQPDQTIRDYSDTSALEYAEEEELNDILILLKH